MWFTKVKLSSLQSQGWRTGRPLTVGPSTSERRSPSSVTTVVVSAAMVIKVEGLLYGNVGLSGVTAWVAEKDPSLKPAS